MGMVLSGIFRLVKTTKTLGKKYACYSSLSKKHEGNMIQNKDW
jgi:hypothetical protein